MARPIREEPTVAINALGRKNFRRRRLRASLRRWRLVIIGVLVVALVAVGTWLLYFSDVLDARAVAVEGAQQVRADQVRRVAGVPLGGQLMRLDTDRIRARVESLAAVRSAEVSRSWPHTLAIQVTERDPVAAVRRSGSGPARAVDVEGVVFPGRTADLPVIEATDEVSVSALAQGARVAASLPESLRASVKRVDTITLRLDDGTRVLWGSSADSKAKADVVQALLKRTPRVIDVTVPGRPTTQG